MHELIKYSIFHYEFEFIHPFNDGNGRMGRFLQTAFLSKWKNIFAYLPVETVVKQRQQEYYNAFRRCYADDGKSNHFIVFMLKAVRDALKTLETDSAKFIQSQTVQVRRLLEVLDENPQSAKQIAELLGLKSAGGLKRIYLEPAIRLGLVAMSIPNKPTSKNQTYYRIKPT